MGAYVGGGYVRVVSMSGGADMGVGGEGVSEGVGVGAGALVMGVDSVAMGMCGVVMLVVSVGTDGVDATVYKGVAVAQVVRHGAPLQIHSRQRRPRA